jgi:hypothetical protein
MVWSRLVESSLWAEARAILGEAIQSFGGGVALVFARTETRAFFDYVWDKATAIFFIKGRIKFHKPNGELAGTSGSPSVLIAYGEAEAKVLENCKLKGKFLRIR